MHQYCLFVMRLADMERVHPEMITAACDLCHHAVGIYPSGQRVLKTGGWTICCHVCAEGVGRPDLVLLAPGAVEERKQSKPRQ